MDSFIGVVLCMGSLVLGILPVILLVTVLNLIGSNKRLTQRVDTLEEQLRDLERKLSQKPVSSWVASADRAAAPAGRVAVTAETPVVPPVSAPVEPAAVPPPAVAEGVPPVAVVPPTAPAAEPAKPTAPVPPSVPPRPPVGTAETVVPPAPRRPSVDITPERLALWAVAIAGGGMFLLAALLAFREAVSAGWIGPGIRFATGIAVGIGAWAIGEILRARKYEVPAAALVGGGAAVLYGALYAGSSRYGLLAPPVAFASMIAVTTVTMVAATAHRSRFQAVLGAIGGYLTPILLSTGENAAAAFMGYLCLLNLGILVAARRRSWWDQVLLAGFFTPILYLGWAFSWRAPDQVAVGLLGATALTFVFVGATVVGRPSRGMAVSGWVSTLAMILAGMVMVWPADPLKVDPVSSRVLEWSLGATSWMAAAYVIGMAIVVSLVPRRIAVLEGSEKPLDTTTLVGGVGGLLLSLLLIVFGTGWLSAGEPRWAPVLLVLVAVPMLVQLLAVPRSFASVTVLIAAVLVGVSGIGVLDGPAAPEVLPVLLLAVGLGVPPALLWRLRGPRVALPAGVAAGGLILMALGDEVKEQPGESFLAAIAVYAIWFFPPFLKPRRDDAAGVTAAAIAGLFVFEPLRRLWLGSLGDEFLGALPILLGAMLLLGAAVTLRQRTLNLQSRELALMVGLVMLAAAVAVPLQLERGWLTVGWALEIALLGLLYQRIKQPMLWMFAAALGMLVCARLFFNPEAYNYGGGSGLIIFNWTLYTWGLPAVFLLVAAWLFGREPRPVPLLPIFFQIASIFLFFVLLNLEVSHAFAHDAQLSFTGEGLAQEMTRSISWAVYGLVLIVVGSIWDSRWTRMFGLLFALLGAAKVCLWDLSQLSGFYRVGSLGGMAIALLLAAVAFQRLVLIDRRKS